MHQRRRPVPVSLRYNRLGRSLGFGAGNGSGRGVTGGSSFASAAFRGRSRGASGKGSAAMCCRRACATASRSSSVRRCSEMRKNVGVVIPAGESSDRGGTQTGHSRTTEQGARTGAAIPHRAAASRSSPPKPDYRCCATRSTRLSRRCRPASPAVARSRSLTASIPGGTAPSLCGSMPTASLSPAPMRAAAIGPGCRIPSQSASARERQRPIDPPARSYRRPPTSRVNRQRMRGSTSLIDRSAPPLIPTRF